MAEIIIKLIQTDPENLALNPENSLDSDDSYAIFDKDHDPLYRVQGSHDGSDLGLITDIVGFVEYHTVDIVDDYATLTLYRPGLGVEYGIVLRKMYARETEGIQYETRTWSYGFPPWSYFSESDLTAKVVNYLAIKAKDGGAFYIDQIGFIVTYSPYSEVKIVNNGVIKKLVDDGIISKIIDNGI